MQFGIYKPGQGYWVRVLTAIGAALCFGACALWAWEQATLLPIPTPTVELTLGEVDGPIATNEIVALRGDGGAELGTAVVQEVGEGLAEGRGSIIVGDVNLIDQEIPVTQTASIALDAGQTVRVTGRRLIPIFERLYLQAAIAGLIIVIGAAVTFYFVGARRTSVEFLISTDNEMKKVNWSTRKDIQGSTLVVIVAAFLITAGLFMVDMGFSWFFRTIGVLTT